ncbi:MAG TPA: LysR family transcriptional regulator [Candidatus Xenobia bacterium]
MNIGSLDLNLLVPLKALLEERHVTHAAERVGLSQPAMSRALQRLRDMFEDPLLVRGSGSRMILTARAEALYQPLQSVLQDVGHLIAAPTLEPSEMRGEVVVATRDYEMTVLLPRMIQALSQKAPGLNLSLRPMVGDDLSPLEENRVDFVVAGSDRTTATLLRRTLIEETFVCVVAADHPAAGHPLTLERYLGMKHCVVSFSEHHTPGFVDRYLAERGHQRNIRVRVPYFLAAAQIVSASDLVTTLPRGLGLHLARHHQLKTLDLPFPAPSFSIYLYWHVRNQSNPIHAWLRQMFVV